MAVPVSLVVFLPVMHVFRRKLHWSFLQIARLFYDVLLARARRTFHLRLVPQSRTMSEGYACVVAVRVMAMWIVRDPKACEFGAPPAECDDLDDEDQENAHEGYRQRVWL